MQPVHWVERVTNLNTSRSVLATESHTLRIELSLNKQIIVSDALKASRPV